MSGKRILVVDDDRNACELLSAALRGEGYDVCAVTDARTAEAELGSFRPELALLDIDLGKGVDGYTLARRMRAASDLPLVFLTAAADLPDRLTGFEVGADDFVTKPFSFLELVARMEAVLRRSGNPSRKVLEVGDIILDADAHLVERNGHSLDLTSMEFLLLEALMRKRGTTFSKRQLLADVWSFEHFDINLVEVYVSSLRKKLEARGPRVIHTVRGVGYVMRAP